MSVLVRGINYYLRLEVRNNRINEDIATLSNNKTPSQLFKALSNS